MAREKTADVPDDRMKTAARGTESDAGLKGKVRVGISGWVYTPWRGTFYPDALAQKNELPYASHALPTIEINSTFYGIRKPEDFRAWYAQTPDDFVFSVKASKLITHRGNLRDYRRAFVNFLASGPLELKDKLGPILWQFPPWFRFNPDTFEPFLAGLPHDTEQALQLAQDNDLTRGASVGIDMNRPLRHAVEIRHDSFVDPAFVKMLRKHRVALVVADTGGKWPEFGDVCTDFMYLRLHGDTELYNSDYMEEVLDRWTQRIRAWANGEEPADMPRIVEASGPKRAKRDVFCYFDNTDKVKAPGNAARVLEKLGIPRVNTYVMPVRRKRRSSSQT